MKGIMMKTSICFLLALLLGLGQATAAETWPGIVDREYARAEIYYYDWDWIRRSSLTADFVRQYYKTKIIIRNVVHVGQFVNSLKPEDFSSVPSPGEVVDVRLVIDLVGADGSVVTFIAGQFGIYTLDRSRKREIDESFKNRFRNVGLGNCP